MSQRKEKYLRHALNEANRLEGVAVELAAMGSRLESRVIETEKESRRLRAGLRRMRKRVLQAERRDPAGTRAFYMTAIALLLSIVALVWSYTAIAQQRIKPSAPANSQDMETVSMAAVRLLDLGEPDGSEEEVIEAEMIIAALLRQNYFSDQIPLPYEEQDFLRTACEEGGVPFPIGLAVTETETGFTNVIGDNGASIGYMQVSLRWHKERMVRLGVTDLSDPFGNFRVGCDYLGELLATYGDPHKALMAYNMGPKRAAELWAQGILESQYSRTVMERAEAWERVLSNGSTYILKCEEEKDNETET